MAEVCGATNRQGRPCGKTAGWGTDHSGVGLCKLHGGSHRNGRKSAAMMVARTMSEELDVEPHDALLWTVRIAAGEVSYCTQVIAALDPDDYAGKPELDRVWTGGESGGGGTETRELAPAVNIWIAVRRDAVDRLAKYSKLALDAGVAERQVQIAERLGEQLATLIGGILGELNLSGAQKREAPTIVRRHLVALEGGAPKAA